MTKTNPTHQTDRPEIEEIIIILKEHDARANDAQAMVERLAGVIYTVRADERKRCLEVLEGMKYIWNPETRKYINNENKIKYASDGSEFNIAIKQAQAEIKKMGGGE